MVLAALLALPLPAQALNQQLDTFTDATLSDLELVDGDGAAIALNETFDPGDAVYKVTFTDDAGHAQTLVSAPTQVIEDLRPYVTIALPNSYHVNKLGLAVNEATGRPVTLVVVFSAEVTGLQADEFVIVNGTVTNVYWIDCEIYSNRAIWCIEMQPAEADGERMTLTIPEDIADGGNQPAPDVYYADLRGTVPTGTFTTDAVEPVTGRFAARLTFDQDMLEDPPGSETLLFPEAEYLKDSDFEVPDEAIAGITEFTHADDGTTEIEVRIYPPGLLYNETMSVVLPAGAALSEQGYPNPELELEVEVDTFTGSTLKALSLSALEFSPSLDFATTRDYEASVGNEVVSTEVTATPTVAGAIVEIQPPDADSGTLGHQVALDVGDTTVTVTVKDANSPDLLNEGFVNKSWQQRYKVVITRAPAAPRVASIEHRDPALSPTNADSLTWRVTFSEDVANVNAADFSIGGTTAMLAVSEVTVSSVYDVIASGGNLESLNATVTLSFASAQDIADTAGNALANTTPTGTNENTYDVDNTAPTVTITDVPDPSSAPFTATFTFSDAVTGFALGDIVVGNGAASEFTTSSASVYTALITPVADGRVTVDVEADVATDLAGNGNTTATQATSTYDATAPRVASIERRDPALSPTNADSLTWRVTFSEDVANVNAADFSIGGTTAMLAVSEVTVSSVYDVTASGGNLESLNATVTLSFASAQDIADTAGNALANTAPTGTNENTYDVDNTAPTVTITDVPDPSSAPFTATFTFSDAVTGFALGDIVVGNGAASEFTTSSASVYTALITPVADGRVTVDVEADVATDLAGNGNTTATQATSTYDATAPRVASIERRDPALSPTNADSLTWRVTFSEDVANVNAADFSIGGTTAMLAVSEVTVSSVYDVIASGVDLESLNATVTLSFASAQDIADTAGNALANTAPTGTNENTYDVDNTAPTVTITDVPDPSSAPFTATFTFSDAVTGFALGDIVVGNGAASEFTTSSASVYTALITPVADGRGDGGRGGGCGHGPGGQRQHGGHPGHIDLRRDGAAGWRPSSAGIRHCRRRTRTV